MKKLARAGKVAPLPEGQTAVEAGASVAVTGTAREPLVNIPPPAVVPTSQPSKIDARKDVVQESAETVLEMLLGLFDEVDTDESGTVDEKELAVMIKDVYKLCKTLRPTKAVQDEVTLAMQEFDTNGDGVLDLSEFVELICTSPAFKFERLISDEVRGALPDMARDCQMDREYERRRTAPKAKSEASSSSMEHEVKPNKKPSGPGLGALLATMTHQGGDGPEDIPLGWQPQQSNNKRRGSGSDVLPEMPEEAPITLRSLHSLTLHSLS